MRMGKPLIDHIRSLGSEFSYTELEKLSKRWGKQNEKLKRKIKR